MKLLRSKFDALGTSDLFSELTWIISLLTVTVKAENITWKPKASDASPHAAIFDLLINPRQASTDDWVSDNAGLFTSEDKQQINYVIQRFATTHLLYLDYARFCFSVSHSAACSTTLVLTLPW